MSESARPAPPPLRIHHLLACAVVVSVQLALWRASIPAEFLDEFSLGAIAFSALGLTLNAVGLTFAVFSVYWQRKGFAALVQPGQWLLGWYFIDVAQILIGRLVIQYLQGDAPWPKTFASWTGSDFLLAAAAILYIIVGIISSLLPVAFYAWGAWRVADSRGWRVFFVLAAVNTVLDVLPLYTLLLSASGVSRLTQQLFMSKYAISSLLMLSILLWIIATERSSGIQRYWTHRLGTGLRVATEALGFASGLYYWFGPY